MTAADRVQQDHSGMKLSLVEKVGYGLGDTASNFVWALMMNFIMYFYTDIFGITAAATGTMLLVARATDGLFDFFVGAVADRTSTRWGRFRPYLLWLCVPLALQTALEAWAFNVAGLMVGTAGRTPLAAHNTVTHGKHCVPGRTTH